jgi:hypothetical protein
MIAMLTNPATSRRPLAAAAVLFALLLPHAASADLWGCVFTNGAPCTWICFETDLTCADITITNTGVQQCVDCPIAPGGGVGLPGALAAVHPDFDGQINLGSGPFPGTVAFQGRILHDFIITRPIGAVLNGGPLVRALAFDDEGNIYTALPPTSAVAGYDPDLHDCAVQATRLGEPLLDPFDASPLGTVATGDVTLSVHVFAAGDGSSPVSASFFDVDFAGLAWSYYGSGAVADETLSWGALKAAY